MHKTKSTLQHLRLTFSSMLFIYQGTLAATGFIVAFLQSKGLGTAQVGIIMSFSSVMMMLAPPLWGIWADKLRSIRRVFTLCLVLAAALYALTPLASFLSNCSVVVMSVVLTLSAFFRAPTSSLMDNWIVRTARQIPGISYGTIRIWGSIGYAIISYGLMYLVTWFSLASPFYFYALAAAAVLLLSRRLPDENTGGTVLSLKDLQVGRIFKDYWLATFLIFLILRGISMYCSSNFLPFLIADVGGDTASLGAINAIRALCEVPLLLLSQRLIRRFGMIRLIITSSILYMLGELGYAAVSSVGQIIAVQCMAGVAFGLFVACQVQYVAQIAPEGLSATAQTMAAALPAMTGIFGNALAGWIMQVLGLRQYYFLSAMVLLTASLVLIFSFPIGTRLLKLKPPRTRLE
jgi:PPP family 3-phenylpropionic acid transporter